MSAAELELARFGPRAELASLEAWADELGAAGAIARGIAGTPFVPKGLRVFDGRELDAGATAANVAACLLAGRELGLEPMAALRSVHIIEGTPALAAIAMRALVISAGHEVWLDEQNAQRAICHGRRAGSRTIHVSRWDMDRATRAGLAGKENWRKQPTAMLIARATSECCRLTAPEALLGLPYSAEELSDGADELELEPAAPRRRRTARRAALEPAETPAPVTAPPTAPAPAPPTESASGGREANGAPRNPDDRPRISGRQRARVNAALRARGLTTREARLEELRRITRRHDLDTSSDLTPDEGSRALAELEAPTTLGRQTAGDQTSDTGEPDPDELREQARAAVLEGTDTVDVPLWPDLPPMPDEPTL